MNPLKSVRATITLGFVLALVIALMVNGLMGGGGKPFFLTPIIACIWPKKTSDFGYFQENFAKNPNDWLASIYRVF